MSRPIAGVAGSISVRSPADGHRREHRIERPEGGVLLEQVQSVVQIVGCRDQQAEGRHVSTRESDGVRPGPTPGADVGERLDHLDGRGRLDAPVGMRREKASARLAQGMCISDGVGQDSRVDDDHPGRRWASSSSRRRSPGSAGSGIGSAARMSAIAARR